MERHGPMDQRFAKRTGYGCMLCVLLTTLAWLPTVHGQDFATQVAPILQRHCIRCHADGDAKAMSVFPAPHRSKNQLSATLAQCTSRLLAAITPDEYGHAEMPQDAEPLSAADRQVISDWLSAGSMWPADVAITAPVVSTLIGGRFVLSHRWLRLLAKAIASQQSIRLMRSSTNQSRLMI